MGSPISLTAFLLSDLLRYVLPTLLALALYLPPLVPGLTLDKLAFPSLVLGYLLTPLIGNLYLAIPSVERRQWSALAAVRRIQPRWDYDKMFYAMKKEERDGIHQSNAYVTFFLMLAAYLDVFAVIAGAQAVYAAFVQSAALGTDATEHFLDGRTRLIFGWDAPSLLVAAASWLLARQALSSYLEAYYNLHAIEYDTYARRELEAGNDIALSIWGTLTCDAQPCPELTVTIRDEEGRTVDTTRTDRGGAFLFRHRYRPLRGKRLLLAADERQFVTSLPLVAGRVPEFTFEIP